MTRLKILIAKQIDYYVRFITSQHRGMHRRALKYIRRFQDLFENDYERGILCLPDFNNLEDKVKTESNPKPPGFHNAKWHICR